VSRHIGIVACSSEGAALCYRTICLEAAERMGVHDHPEVSMHTHPLAQYMRAIRADDWDAVARLMLSSAEKLARAGADFLICPDNTIHHGFDRVEAASPRPWLHIAREVGREAQARGHRKLGVLGTRWLMEGPVYKNALEALGLAMAIPDQDDRTRMNSIIFDELVCGRFEDAARARVSAMIERLRAERCDAVVLGCTEIPLLIAQEDSVLPILDSTRLLARAALREALA
jgi:aspartate racemase